MLRSRCTQGFNVMWRSKVGQRRRGGNGSIKTLTTWMDMTSSYNGNSFLAVIQRLAVMNPPSRGLSRSVARGGGHWPHVHDAGALSQAVGGQVGQREGRQPADPEALVLPGQHVICQVDFLVDHRELDLWVLTRNHLRENDRDISSGIRSERSEKSFQIADMRKSLRRTQKRKRWKL